MAGPVSHAIPRLDPPLDAAEDLVELEALQGSDDLRIRFSGEPESSGRVSLSVYSGEQDLELSHFLPILESLGLWVFDELHWSLGQGRWHVYDFRVRHASAAGSTSQLMDLASARRPTRSGRVERMSTA